MFQMVGTRVYIGGLTYGVRDRDLEKFFKGYGRIRDILIKNGYGFVEFEDYRDADDAVYELNGKELLGERVSVEHARGPQRSGGGRDGNYGGGGRNYDRGGGGGGGYGGGRHAPWMDKYGLPKRTEFRLIVENLSSRVSWQDLKDFMRSTGEVTYADAHVQRRNEGVVEFATYGDMKNALLKLDGKELNGRRIKLIEDRPRRGRSRSYSRSRSRSRGRRSRSFSRSRSRSRSRSKSASRSRSRSRSHSRGKEASKSRSRSRSPGGNNRSRSRTPEQNNSNHRGGSRSVSRSPPPGDDGNDDYRD